jgi:hypothetical protein
VNGLIRLLPVKLVSFAAFPGRAGIDLQHQLMARLSGRLHWSYLRQFGISTGDAKRPEKFLRHERQCVRESAANFEDYETKKFLF